MSNTKKEPMKPFTIYLTKAQLEWIESKINNDIFKYNKAEFIRELINKDMNNKKK